MWAEDKGRQTEPLLKHDDSNFKGVKEEGRKFNDILFGLLFIAMCVGMVSISSFAFARGNPNTLIPSWEFASKNITATAEQKSSLWFQDAVAQMKSDRDIIAGGLGLSIVLAALWIQLMKKFTKFFI